MRRRDFLRHSALTPLAVAHSLRGQQTDLRITGVRAYAIQLTPQNTFGDVPDFTGPHDPERWSYLGPFAQITSTIFAVIETNQGITGYGFGAGGTVGRDIIDGHLKHLLLGMDPLEIELLWDQLYSSAFAYGRRGVFVMALSAVDNALWDLFGKFTGQPVWRLLGGKVKDKAPAYQTGGDIHESLDRGIHHFKFPVRQGWRHGEDGKRQIEKQLREQRDLMGRGRMMIDCLGRWNDVRYTLDMAHRLEDIGLYAIEEALLPDNFVGKAQLVREIQSTNIASGEHEYGQYGAEQLFHHKAVDIIQPDVSWCGGVTALRKIATMAAEHNVLFMPHRGGSKYALPLVLANSHCPMAESFGTGQQGTEIMRRLTSQFEDGHYLPSDEPGFGVDMSEPLLRDHAV